MKKTSNPQISETDRVSFGQKMAYALGNVAANFLSNGMGYLALPIYSVGLGVSASLVGLALGIPRTLDAFIDPMMGNISDNTRSRWGRRRPYIVVGGILCGIAFALMWRPNPHWSSSGLFAFFFVASVFYYLCFTVWNIPYTALGYELSYDYKERTSVQAYRVFIGFLFALAMPWMYKMCFWSWDKLLAPNIGTITHRLQALTEKSHIRGAEVGGAGVVGVIFGVLIIITAVIPAFCRERAEAQCHEKMPFVIALKSTFKSKPYMILTVMTFLACFGLFMIQPFGLYVNLYYVFNGNREAAATMCGWGGTVSTLIGLLSMPFVAVLANKVGKKQAVLLGLAFTALGYLSIWWCYTPKYPWLQLAPNLFIGPAWFCCLTLIPSMTADICDFDELETGRRREGMYGAVTGWIVKVGVGVVTCVTGIVVSLAGVDPKALTQTASTVFNLRALFVGIPCLFLVAAVIVGLYYPITEKAAREARSILNDRKNGCAAEPSPEQHVIE
ncbi:MAG: MFS transporter [Armatimonadota bacterium]